MTINEEIWLDVDIIEFERYRAWFTLDRIAGVESICNIHVVANQQIGALRYEHMIDFYEKLKELSNYSAFYSDEYQKIMRKAAAKLCFDFIFFLEKTERGDFDAHLFADVRAVKYGCNKEDFSGSRMGVKYYPHVSRDGYQFGDDATRLIYDRKIVLAKEHAEIMKKEKERHLDE
ncbi:hypothetical protein FGB62_228g00 [Gracilaria domingensis]|nr:hypothetical protein FGB62_228g00 [Gracilaria domingensis]